MPRWSDEDARALAELRATIGDRLGSVPQFPEVVGDRKLLRFLRGHDYSVPKAAALFCQFLDWRRELRVDEIRESIVRGGMNHPTKFPNGEKILSLIPQVVLAHEVTDYFGCALVVEQFTFSPSVVLKEISLDEYLKFVIYCLEYRSIVLEQLSEEAERKKFSSIQASHSSEPYGTILYACVIRDLRGVGWDHVGSTGREILGAVIKVASDNYPELMRRCFIINSPFIFYTAWIFIQGLLAAKTVGKIMVLGADYLEHLLKEVHVDSLPHFLGGKDHIGHIPFNFDSADNGLLSMTSHSTLSE